MTFKELKALIKICKNSGVQVVKFNGTELQFTHEAVSPKEKSPIQEAYEKKVSEFIEAGAVNPNTGKPFTDEETLYWSTTMTESQ